VRVVALIVRAGAVLVAAGFLFSLLLDGAETPVGAAQGRAAETATTPASTTAAKPKPKPKPKFPPGVVSIVATGDIVVGSTPNLPVANFGRESAGNDSLHPRRGCGQKYVRTSEPTR
jgi:multisubunit Na+/H+ antiporter MnhB subunit